MRIGTASALYRYPVKGLRGESLTAVAVRHDGFACDRSRALLVATPDHARTGKTYRGKENARLHTVRAIEDARTLAAADGVAITAVSGEPHYFDLMPISIVFDTWLGDLEALTGNAVDALRFRPNIVVAADAAFGGREGDLLGARLRIGSAEFDVRETIRRCVTPSYDLATGERDAALARAIAVDRKNEVGIYCTVAAAGSIARGDGVERLADEIREDGGPRSPWPA